MQSTRFLSSLFLYPLLVTQALGQAPYFSSPQPLDVAQDIAVNRGSAAVWQLLQKLQTRASLIMVTAHPDDEDGGMLTYYSRGRGARVTLLTLNRGEGGANLMSPHFFDALGLVRTMELIEAGRYYGVDQYWTRVVDYGFSKNKEEALGQWTRERVLRDVVRVVRMTRPLVVTSVFVGGPGDGHGNHEFAGLMAKEVYEAAGDPNMFPEQISAGLRPWTALKYYARVPFRRGGGSGAAPVANVEVPVGEFDAMLGASYVQIAREGLGYQKSQNGGPSVPQAGMQMSAYRRHASRVQTPDKESSFFDGIDVSLMGIAQLAGQGDAAFLKTRLHTIQSAVTQAAGQFNSRKPEQIASLLAQALKETEATLADVARSSLSPPAKLDVQHELDIKRAQFQHALAAALGLSVSANVSVGEPTFRGQPDTFRMATPGQKFNVRLHVANQSGAKVNVKRTWLQHPQGEPWEMKTEGAIAEALEAKGSFDARFTVQVAERAAFTRPYWRRSNIEQTYYDLTDERYAHLSLAPYPLSGWTEFEFEGALFRVGQVVQTTQRITGLGTVAEPLAVGPALSVTVQPRMGIVPLTARSFPVTAVVRSNVKGAAEGKVRLELPSGWTSTPSVGTFAIPTDGAEQALEFQVTPAKVEGKPYEVAAVAEYGGRQYREGYQVTGYSGARPYFLYNPSTHTTIGVDVKVAPGLKAGYVTGSGDEVPVSLTNLGVKVSFLSAADLTGGDLSTYDVIVLGVRAYAVRDDLKTGNARMLEYVRNGGVLIVQYNTPEFDHNYGPYPYVMGNNPEEVTDQGSKIEILDSSNPIFLWPNKITAADFAHWVEERGSKFMQTWDPRYTPLLSTNDAAQAPQKGGLLFARYGKGVYVYNAYAFYRQLPHGVPGAYRLMANLLSLARRP